MKLYNYEVNNIDEAIQVLEDLGLGWSLDHTGNMIEARIWQWPLVIGRYRPYKIEPLLDMLCKAADDDHKERR